MAGTVYLRTNRFEVKLEGIAFKTRDFESLCSMDFLFPHGKTWGRKPVVGIDVMRHPRDPSNILLLLCFGVGCIILKFNSGVEIPDSIFRFFTDERIRFVGFGIPENNDLFPLEELGMTKEKADIGYLTAKFLDDNRYTKSELAVLARKILRVKSVIGLTESSSSERHELIKSAICQLFMTTAIGMALLGNWDRKISDDAHKRSKSFLKNLNQLPLFTEGWFKFPKTKKVHGEKSHDVPVETTIIEGFSGKRIFNENIDDIQVDDNSLEYDPFHGKSVNAPYGVDDDEGGDHHRFHARRFKGFFDDALNYFKHKDSVSAVNNNPCSKETCDTQSKPPLKGILKSPSSVRTIECPNMRASRPESRARTPDSSSTEESIVVNKTLRRANSKGFNVSFKGVDFSNCHFKGLM